MSQSEILALDIGTTSVKAVLFDLSGHVIAKGLQEYPLEKPAPGIVELECEVYWNAAKTAIAMALAGSPSSGRDVKALGVTSQAETLIALDESGKPLRKAIVWLDNRSEREAGLIADRFGRDRVYEITGQQEIVPTWPATKILWLKANEPEVFARTRKYLMVEDFIDTSIIEYLEGNGWEFRAKKTDYNSWWKK